MEYSELKKRHFGTNDTGKKFNDEEIIKADEEPNFQEAIDLDEAYKEFEEELKHILRKNPKLNVKKINFCTTPLCPVCFFASIVRKWGCKNG